MCDTYRSFPTSQDRTLRSRGFTRMHVETLRSWLGSTGSRFEGILSSTCSQFTWTPSSCIWHTIMACGRSFLETRCELTMLITFSLGREADHRRGDVCYPSAGYRCLNCARLKRGRLRCIVVDVRSSSMVMIGDLVQKHCAKQRPLDQKKGTIVDCQRRTPSFRLSANTSPF